MIRTTISVAKDQLEDLIDAARRGEEVVITTNDGDDEEIRIIVSRPEDVPPYRKAGSAKGEIWISDDFDEPLEEFEAYRS